MDFSNKKTNHIYYFIKFVYFVDAQHAAIGEQSQQQLPINPDHQQKSVQTGQHSKNKQKQLLKENPQEQLSSVKPSTSSQKQEQSGKLF